MFNFFRKREQTAPVVRDPGPKPDGTAIGRITVWFYGEDEPTVFDSKPFDAAECMMMSGTRYWKDARTRAMNWCHNCEPKLERNVWCRPDGLVVRTETIWQYKVEVIEQ